MPAIGSKLKDLREKNGLTPEKLADEIQLTKSIIWSYELEKKEPSLNHLVRLADFFNVTVDYFINDYEKKMVIDLQKDTINKCSLIVDNIELSESELKEAVEYIRARRIMKNL
ncbi:helix-turn-helix domain-containing protein [Rossellomorea oryzaecorticis]|uniref:Helix-turn-helix domain-containing protein n=1 Tax=Rossellomorea oryzaecorticis TaxID=1396505 RepID=A0ABW8VPE1_9BACI